MADVGNGVTLTTTFFTAAVESIQLPFGTRAAVETSHLGTTNYKTFMPAGLADPGEFEATIQYDGATSPAVVALIGGTAAVSVTIPAPPDSTATNAYTATAFVIDAGTVGVTNDDLMRATVVMKLTGAYTHA